MKRRQNVAFRRFLALFLCLILLMLHLPLAAFAEGEPEPETGGETQEPEAVTGMINGTQVRVRTSPGTASDANLLLWNGSVVFLYLPHPVTILQSDVPDESGGTIPWYAVSFQYEGETLTGYVRSDLVTVRKTVETPTDDKTFEEQLEAFPEDYRPALRALHEEHPNWYFEAFDTQLDWAAVQNKENELGRSYTNSRIQSHYSTAPGSYDWYSDTYFVLEGGGWRQAAPELVAHYMDPRNALSEQLMFQFESLAFQPATQTEENIEKMLAGSFMAGQQTAMPDGTSVSYARAFLDAASMANVSAFHLVSRCIQEVGWQGQSYCKGTYPGYEGYYNFFNIGANTGAEAGMAYAKRAGWNSAYTAIVAGASFIGGSYIAIGQDTPYFQKFDVVRTVGFGTHQYMSNIAAPRSEGLIQYEKYKDMGFLDTNFTFRIPIYRNMPESPCPAPAETGSPNCYLTSLSVEGYDLTPTFDFYESLNGREDAYTIIINGSVSSLNISATAASAQASVSGCVGTVSVQAGENDLAILCTAASGAVHVYTVRVILNDDGSGGETPPADPPQEPEEPEVPQPVASGWNPPYRVGIGMISGITLGTDAGAFLSSLGVFGNAWASLTDENGTAVTGGPLRNGLLLQYFDGANTVPFTVVIYGDTNQDSAVDAIDLLVIRRALLGITQLGPAAAEAADVNHDGSVDAIDLLLVRRTLLGLSSIQQ